MIGRIGRHSVETLSELDIPETNWPYAVNISAVDAGGKVWMFTTTAICRGGPEGAQAAALEKFLPAHPIEEGWKDVEVQAVPFDPDHIRRWLEASIKIKMTGYDWPPEIS